MPVRTVSRLLLPALLAAPAVAGELQLATLPVSLPASSHPRRVLVADVTSDGQPDLVAAPETLAQVLVRPGAGALTFGATVTTTVSAAVANWRAGDMDGDGDLDLVCEPGNAAQLRVLLGDGSGAFAPAGTLVLTPLNLGDHELLDADEDGDLDAALLTVGKLSLAAGDGAGQLAPPGPAIDGPPLATNGFGLHTAALDADGHADLLAIGHYQHGGFSWAGYRGDGAGQFAPAPGAGTGSFDADFFGSCVGDYDGDGWTDLFVSYFDYVHPGAPGFVQLLHNVGGALQGSYPADRVETPAELGPVRMADLDGDGYADLVGTHAFHALSTLWVLRGDGTPDFAPVSATPLPSPSFDVALGDVDLDGVTDVVTAHWDTSSLTVLRNTAPLAGWSLLDGALAGPAGLPHLSGSGMPSAGQTISLNLHGAPPAAPATLVVGLAHAGVPFKGGLLVPSPDLLLLGLLTDAQGDLLLQASWPAGLPAGFDMWLQQWIAEAGAPHGLAASNGLGATVAP